MMLQAGSRFTPVRIRSKWSILLPAIALGICLALVLLVPSVINAQPSGCASFLIERGKPPAPNPPAAPMTAQDFFAHGDYAFDHKDCDGAIVAYSRALELNPGFAEAYNNRAYSFMAKGEYAQALPDLDRAIELRPDYVNALMNRGDIYNYYYALDRKRAIADYDRVIQLGARQTSVCGHRLLAIHDGWNLGVLVDLVSHGTQAGCVP